MGIVVGAVGIGSKGAEQRQDGREGAEEGVELVMDAVPGVARVWVCPSGVGRSVRPRLAGSFVVARHSLQRVRLWGVPVGLLSTTVRGPALWLCIQSPGFSVSGF